MNREDVLRMAWEADKFANKSAAPSGSEWWQLERDTHLAALVAAAAKAEEREACAYRAGIALLGADRGLANRVDQSIRARKENT